MILYETEFQHLLDELRREVPRGHSYALLGSPLMRSRVVVLGNNWGGALDTPPQRRMLLTSDVLIQPTNATYRGYLKFMQRGFGGHRARTLEFFQQTVSGNANLIRTPTEAKTYAAQRTLGQQLSPKYWQRMLPLIDPAVVLCFGTGAGGAFDLMGQILELPSAPFAHPDLETERLANGWNCYRLALGRRTLYGFPHGSRLDLWWRDIEQNPLFRKLFQQVMP